LGRALRALRNASLRGAEINVALCPGMAAHLVGEGVPSTRIAVIPNWADGARIQPLAPERNPLRAAWGLEGRFVIGYCGNLGRAHEVEPVVELMTLLADEPGLLFLFVGAGFGYRALRAEVAARGLANVVFRPYQDRARLPESLTAPDLHLVTLRPACEGLVMPSKLYGALAAGRPVVFVGDPEGDVGRIVGAGLGLVASPQAMPALAEEIRALRRDPARLARLGAAARRAYEASSMDASLAAWSRCLRAAALPAGPRPLAQAVAAE
jgi:glycosyltransferase involved in cell wall biosynthesis